MKTNIFIEKAKKVHGDKYLYDKTEYKYVQQKVIITCIIHGDFLQTPNNHLNGNGCSKCTGHNRTTEEFIELSKKNFGDNVFNYSKVNYINLRAPVILICPKGHEFQVSPDVHLNKKSAGGCCQCRSIKISTIKKYTHLQWICAARKKHNDNYIYDNTVYVNSDTDVIITCKIHGDFLQSPKAHLRGYGCKPCGIEKTKSSVILTNTELEVKLKNAEIIHNNKYKYISFCRDGRYLKINILCKIHGQFKQRLDHHLNGHGCHRCVKYYSKQQIEWLNYRMISDGFIQHACNIGEFKINGTMMSVDGYNSITNTIYEFQGDFWHGNPKVFNPIDINPITNTTYNDLYIKTKEKMSILNEMGYNLIEMWETDWKRGKHAIYILQKKWRNIQYKKNKINIKY